MRRQTPLMELLSLFFLSRALDHQCFTFDSRFLYKLKHRVHLFKNMCRIFHFRFSLIFIKVYDLVHTLRLNAVPKRFLLRIGLVSILAIRNTNRNNSAPLKNVERSDFVIFSAKCEQRETEQGNGKVKVFW